MEAGAKEQARLWGSPAQVRAIALLNVPNVGVAVTVTLPDPPEEIVSEEGFVPNAKFVLPVVPPAQLGVNGTGPEIWLVMLGLPTACT